MDHFLCNFLRVFKRPIFFIKLRFEPFFGEMFSWYLKTAHFFGIICSGVKSIIKIWSADHVLVEFSPELKWTIFLVKFSPSGVLENRPFFRKICSWYLINGPFFNKNGPFFHKICSRVKSPSGFGPRTMFW